MSVANIARLDQAPCRVVMVTLDSHMAGAVERARDRLADELPGLELNLHVAAEWGDNPEALEACRADIEQGDVIIVSMLFMEDHIRAVLPWLQARRDQCDAMVVMLSAGEVIKLTKIGRFKMDGSDRGPLALLKRLRGGKKKGGSAGAQQVKMLRRLPQILRFIPGAAQDMRAYFLSMQYYLAGSDDNVANLVRYLVDRYASGPRAGLRGLAKVPPPVEYPDTGLYHPGLQDRVTEELRCLPKIAGDRGRVGVLVMRSYVLAGDTEHYDGVLNALEARGFSVVPAFASGLDAQPAIERFFLDANGVPMVDAVVSLTGFSLVGGPAYNDSKAAEDILARLDVPYLAAHAVEFQSLEQWEDSDRGLLPVEATIMVAIPELDGATGPMVFGGRGEQPNGERGRRMVSHPERATKLADRIAKLIDMRHTPIAERKVAAVLFNFPPNGGSTGTAAYLSVFASLFNTLQAMHEAGYTVEMPESVDALRDAILNGNADRFGADANVHTRIGADDHVRREPYLAEIEAQWGASPGRQQSDGSGIFVLGRQFGNVFVGVQPAFGYEGDPMRLLFESGFAPTHAFSAFYRYLREDFAANAVLHFGTHGALEFMPGKQSGMSASCWPDRLIGDLPNIYLYAANNPSEGTIAKRRAAATLVSYLTPPLAQAGLYKGLVELKGTLDRWRTLPPEDQVERARMVPMIQEQAAVLDLAEAEPAWSGDAKILSLADAIVELEHTLIPHGLHVVGKLPGYEQRANLLKAMAETIDTTPLAEGAIDRVMDGVDAKTIGGADDAAVERLRQLTKVNAELQHDSELPAILHALEGGFVRPAPGGDLLRTPAMLPTGRNVHGFDPFRLPSAFAVKDGAMQAAKLVDRHMEEGNALPESIAIVLWGTDNLKSEGGPIAQALWLIGAEPRFDSYGRLCGADLTPLDELHRPRIDVVITLSGIFRDLLPLQTKLLAEACFLAASADEPLDQNFVRKHALEHMEREGCDLETASLRVFSNADGAYGSNVNQMVDAGTWIDEDELAEVYSKRKSFAYGRDGKPTQQQALLKSVLANVDLAYQNLESVELGVTTVDHYFDTLGGIGRAVRSARGDAVPVYIGDQTRGEGRVRTLEEQVALETRTRMLNPKWYEGMLEHGYEGVRQIEAAVTNTMGWSATTGQVAPWVYQQLTQTYVLDREMRDRLATLNPKASAKVANRLLEAHERNYWQPDDDVLEALRRAGEELEDRVEGISEGVAA